MELELGLEQGLGVRVRVRVRGVCAACRRGAARNARMVAVPASPSSSAAYSGDCIRIRQGGVEAHTIHTPPCVPRPMPIHRVCLYTHARAYAIRT